MKRIKKLVVLFWAMMCIIGFIPMKDVQASGEIVISDVQFQENGKVLGYGDILHFSCIINSLNPITSCEVEFCFSDSIEFELKYNPTTNRYEGQSEPIPRWLYQSYYSFEQVYAEDDYGHYCFFDSDDLGDDIYAFSDGDLWFYLNDDCAHGLHDSYWENVSSATCIKNGKKQLVCKICHTVLQEVTIPATGHTLGEWKVTEKAACTSVGTKIQKCTVCKKTVNTDTIPATGHTFEDWIIDDATVSEEGSKTRFCEECGYYEQEVFPKLKPTIKISSKNVTITSGKSKTIKVSGLANGDRVNSWSSSNKTVAVVDKNGKITAQNKAGKASITVTLKPKIRVMATK